MALDGYSGRMTAGNEDGMGTDASSASVQPSKPKLFARKNPGSPGKLGKTSGMAESLSKLRGKGALK